MQLRNSRLIVCVVFFVASNLSLQSLAADETIPQDTTSSLAMQELISLATQYETRRNAYWSATRNAKTPDEQSKAAELNPDDEFIPRFLELEERYRGTAAAFDVLLFLFNNAARYGNPKAVASRARLTAGERLGLHYLNHPDADLCIQHVRHGAIVP